MNCPNKRGKLVLTSIALRHAVDSLQDFNPMIEKIHDKVEAIFENIATQLPGDKENNITFLKDYESFIQFPPTELEQEFRGKYKELLMKPIWSEEKLEGFGPSPLEGLLKEFFNKAKITIKKKDGE